MANALYFSGEALRVLGRRGDMLGAFKNYLYEADQDKKEAYDGSRDVCYKRASGYCAERTAYIDHLLANDAFAHALTLQGSSRIKGIDEALDSVEETVNVSPCGFKSDYTIKSSEDLLEQIGTNLNQLGRSPDLAKRLLLRLQAAKAARKCQIGSVP